MTDIGRTLALRLGITNLAALMACHGNCQWYSYYLCVKCLDHDVMLFSMRTLSHHTTDSIQRALKVEANAEPVPSA